MPFKYGAKAALWIDALDVSQYFNEMTYSASIDTADTSTFGLSWKTAVEGDAQGKVDAKGFYDANEDAALTTMLRNGGSVLTALPAGAVAIGDLARLVAVHETNFAESSPVGGAVLTTLSVIGDGITGFGTVLHTLSVDTNTTTGATFDGTAQTTTGWHAHLHVTAVSAGSWVVKLQDASASNFSDVADVTGGAFAAATTATFQRLSSASGATLRRYIRYVATRTGGVGGDNITFGLVFSRN